MHALHSKINYKNWKLWLILAGLIICVISLLIFVNASFADQNANQESDINDNESTSNYSNGSYLTLHSTSIEPWKLELKKNNNPDNIKLQWCTKDPQSEIRWMDFTVSIPFSQGNDIYIRGINNSSIAKSSNDYWYFSYGSAPPDASSLEISGNIMSLLDCYNPPNEINSDYCFCKFFNNMSGIKSCKDLSLPNNVTAHCYESMFDGCVDLQIPPALPATVLADSCYDSMFWGCGNLQIPSNFLPATNLKAGCYKNMFCCSAITSAPDLPATSLVNNCYESMFEGCEKLSSAPTISATTLDSAGNCCSNMFSKCLSLKTPPQLKATSLADNCYSHMFDGAAITTAPELPATNLFKSCYDSMFANCINLVSAPKISAEKLSNNCCENMFYCCEALKNPPDLPVLSLESRCYANMFKASGLTKAPELPATTLASGCYDSMFDGCSSLVKAPELPATTLASGCYDSMFYGCSSLVKAPTTLPSQNLTYSCYYSMFGGCTSLIYGPDIPNVTFVKFSCSLMFSSCSNLTHLKVSFKMWPENESSNRSWLEGVNPSGYFECPDELDTSIRDASHIPSGWKLANEDLFSFSTTDETASISYNFEKGVGGKNVNIKYSKNCVNWENLTLSAPTSEAVKIADITKDEKLYIYGDNLSGLNNANTCFSFSSDNNLKVRGKYSFFLDLNNQIDIPNPYCFKGLFKGCSGLTNALELPWAQLTEGCYQSMFEGCTSLENAPALPATELTKNCYSSMFEGCENIIFPPDMAITSVEKNCCAYMFKGCSRMTKGPDLGATELKDGCYMGMFEGCNALVGLKVGFSEWFDDAQHYSFDHFPTFEWLKDTQNLFMNAQQFYCPPDLDTDSIPDESHVPAYWLVQKDAKITASITGYNEEYDGQAHTITVSVTSPSDADIKYKGPDDDDFKEANPEFTNAGTYTVEVKISKANYVTLQTSADVVIQKSTSGTMSIGSFEKFYSGAEPDYTATFNGLDITPVKGVDYVTYREPGEDVLENDGAYTVHAVWINNNSNFDVAEATGSLTIKKASAKLVADKNSMSEGEGMPTLTAHLEGARFGVDDLASDDYSVEPVNNGDGTYTLNPNLSEKGQRFLKNFNVEMVPSVLKVYSTGGGGGGGGTEVVTETVTEQLPGTTQEIVKTEKADDKVSYMGQNNSSEDNDSSPLSPIAIASLIANALLLAGLVFMALKFRKAL